MNRGKTQFTRLLELDRRIRDGKYPNCLTFSADWEVSQKTVQRDIDYLRDQLGAPVEYDWTKKGFFYSDINWFLPSVSLSEGDLFALLVAARALEQYRGTPVARDLEQVFRKIAALLPDKISMRPELIFSRFSFTSPPAKPISRAIWTTTVRAVLRLRCLRVTYRAMGAGQSKQYVIEPYHIANLQGEWYVFGRHRRWDTLLQLAIPRIRKASLLQTTFEIPADFDPARLLAATFGRFALGSEVHTVRLLFASEIVPWVLERQWHPKQKTRKRKNGDIELIFPAAGLFEVMRWVLAWGRHVTVLDPKSLSAMVRDEVAAMGRVRGAGNDHASGKR